MKGFLLSSSFIFPKKYKILLSLSFFCYKSMMAVMLYFLKMIDFKNILFVTGIFVVCVLWLLCNKPNVFLRRAKLSFHQCGYVLPLTEELFS